MSILRANRLEDLNGNLWTAQQQVNSVESLRTSSFTTDVSTLWLSGYYGAGTAGGGLLYRDSIDLTTADNGGTVFVDGDGVRWKRHVTGALSVKDFGATGDGTTNDSPFIQAAIDYMISVINSESPWGAVGARLYYPRGTYLHESQIVIRDTVGLALVGEEGRGPLLLCKNSALSMYLVGDTTDEKLTQFIDFENLYFRYRPDTVNEPDTTKALEFHNTAKTKITNCVFSNFDISFHGHRANTPIFNNCVFKAEGGLRTSVAATAGLVFEGSTTGTGGNIYFSNCEIRGSNNWPILDACILIKCVDGLYLENCHMNNYKNAIHFNPEGTGENGRITDFTATSCYFDGNSSPLYAVLAEGTVNSGGLYQNIRFNQCLFRGAYTARNSIRCSITDGGTFASSGGKVKNFSFDDCVFKQNKEQAIWVDGDSKGKLEIEAFSVTDSVFEENRDDATALGVMDIVAEVESFTLNSNIFMEARNAADFAVQMLLGLPPSGSPSINISNNDFSNSNYTDKPIKHSDVSGSPVSVHGNLHSGDGQFYDELYKTATTDATAVTIYERLLPQPSSGVFNFTIVGATEDGAQHLVYKIEAGFEREVGQNVSFVGGDPTITKTTKSVGFETAPTVSLAGNSIHVDVTGIASTTVSWVCRVELVQSK